MDELWQPCVFCSGNRHAPDHDERCCGHQGAIEAREDPTPEPTPAPVVEIQTIPPQRATSVMAFYNAVNTGQIETRRQQVWMALFVLGPSTANEIYEYLKTCGIVMSIRFVANTSGRLTELRDDGLVREEEPRPCRITKQWNIVWAAVPLTEYVGPALVVRCTECNQTIRKYARRKKRKDAE